MKKLVSAILCLSMVLSLCIYSSAAVDLSGYTVAQTAEEIRAAKIAKKALTNLLEGRPVIDYYREYYTRVTLPENLEREDVKAYKAELDIIEALLATDTIYLAQYYEVEGAGNLESLWISFRSQITISHGLRDKCYSYLESKGYSFSYNGLGLEWQSWIKTLSIMNEIDSRYSSCTDAEGLYLYNNFCNAVDNIKKLDDSILQTQTVRDLKMKTNVYYNIPAIEFQMTRDTKEEKSPETIELKKRIDNIYELMKSYTATALDYYNAYIYATKYCETEFQKAINVGKPFVQKARALYYSVSNQKALYTSESWANVDNAMNYCDKVYIWGNDSQCQKAYDELQNSIDNLVLIDTKPIKITVSSASAQSEQTINITITPQEMSNIIYGNFTLYYDDTVLDFISSDVFATAGASSVFFRLDCQPITKAEPLATLTFKVKENAPKGEYNLLLETDRIRTKSLRLTNAEVVQGSVNISSGYYLGAVSKNDSSPGLSDSMLLFMYVAGRAEFDSAQLVLADINKDGKVELSDAMKSFMTVAEKSYEFSCLFNDGSSQTTQTATPGNLVQIPEPPVKEGYVFKGWYTGENGTGKKIFNKTLAVSDITYYAYFDEFKQGPMTKDEIAVGGWCAIYTEYAVEDDFYMLVENGISFIIMDYTHGDTKSEQCLKWAEKYGIKLLINDYDMLKDMPLTKEKVLEYTAAYINSPAFAGNNLIDEPSGYDIEKWDAITSVYMEALPGYDMHINLLGHYASYEMFGEKSYKDYIDQFAQKVSANHLCSDTYPLRQSSSSKYTYEYFYAALENVSDAATENSLEHWEYLQTIAFMDNETRVPNIADIRFQMYAFLAFGASKMMHFTYDVPGYVPGGPSNVVYAMRDYAHNYTEIWDWAQLVNQEIGVFSKVYSSYNYSDTGVYKTGKVPLYVDKIQEYNGSEITDISSNGCLLIGSFTSKDGSGKAILLTNASEITETNTKIVEFKAESEVLTVYQNGQKTILKPQNGVYTINLKPGQGVFIEV